MTDRVNILISRYNTPWIAVIILHIMNTYEHNNNASCGERAGQRSRRRLTLDNATMQHGAGRSRVGLPVSLCHVVHLLRACLVQPVRSDMTLGTSLRIVQSLSLEEGVNFDKQISCYGVVNVAVTFVEQVTSQCVIGRKISFVC